MKKLSILFAALAVLLSDAMCAVVGYQYRQELYNIEMGGSAPADIAFLYAIPFAAAIIVCIVIAVLFYKRSKK